MLLVEDNPADVFLLTELLTSAETLLEIEPVETLEKALRRLDRGDIDVVVSDLSLPDSRGLETFEGLHGHQARIPIIVLSGLDDEEMALRTVELGAQDYLVKGRVDRCPPGCVRFVTRSKERNSISPLKRSATFSAA